MKINWFWAAIIVIVIVNGLISIFGHQTSDDATPQAATQQLQVNSRY